MAASLEQVMNTELSEMPDFILDPASPQHVAVAYSDLFHLLFALVPAAALSKSEQTSRMLAILEHAQLQSGRALCFGYPKDFQKHFFHTKDTPW